MNRYDIAIQATIFALQAARLNKGPLSDEQIDNVLLSIFSKFDDVDLVLFSESLVRQLCSGLQLPQQPVLHPIADQVTQVVNFLELYGPGGVVITICTGGDNVCPN